MKNFREAWAETRPYREITFALAIAGVSGTAWGVLRMPEAKLSLLLGLMLLLAAAATALVFLLASLFQWGWFVRLEERLAFERWKAEAPARVAAAVVRYDSRVRRPGQITYDAVNRTAKCKETGNWCPTLTSEMSRMYDEGFAAGKLVRQDEPAGGAYDNGYDRGYARGYEDGQRDITSSDTKRSN